MVGLVIGCRLAMAIFSRRITIMKMKYSTLIFGMATMMISHTTNAADWTLGKTEKADMLLL